MREIHVDVIVDTVARLAIQACCILPDDFYAAMKDSVQKEASPVGRKILQQLLANADLAAAEHLPLCQDTGLAVVFAELGQDVHIVGGSFKDAINAGIAKGYTEGYLRKSSVAEPLFERKNTQDNTPAVLHISIVPGDKLILKLLPKGAGSENKSALKMLVPADGLEGVKKFVVETVRLAGSSPCPPVVIGVGIGGTMELAALCSKRALTREIDSKNPDSRYAAFEEELCTALNQLGIGPQGLGGSVTAFKVFIEQCPTHIASLPVAVNICCHSFRHAEAVL